jgi:hypothetical protein
MRQRRDGSGPRLIGSSGEAATQRLGAALCLILAIQYSESHNPSVQWPKEGFVARKSDNYPLVFMGGGLGLLWMFHIVWSIVFEDWVKHQLEHFVGHTLAEMIERFGSVGFPLLGAAGIIWFLIGYNRKSREGAQDEEAFFKQFSIFCETKSIKWDGGEDSNLYENEFYLIVGNALSTGKVLKRSQARIFHMGEPLLSQVKETGQTEIDIRHGEFALFGIGKIISPEIFGTFHGWTTLDSKAKTPYSNNIPLGRSPAAAGAMGSAICRTVLRQRGRF